MKIARALGVVFLIAIAAVLWPRARTGEGGAVQAGGAVPAAAPASEPDPDDPGLVIFGFVRSRYVDSRAWFVRGTSLRYVPEPTPHRSEINSRGRFELCGLEDVDYSVELVAEGDPPLVLSRVDYVRPGGGELALEVDPEQLRRFVAAKRPTQ